MRLFLLSLPGFLAASAWAHEEPASLAVISLSAFGFVWDLWSL